MDLSFVLIIFLISYKWMHDFQNNNQKKKKREKRKKLIFGLEKFKNNFLNKSIISITLN